MLCGVSKRTVERRLQLYHLSTQNYTVIEDHDLDEIVQAMSSAFPRCGEKMVAAMLHAQGLHVPRERVRACLRRVDPTGIQMRLRRVLTRRVYHVSSPNALWHFDGHHKLIRWRVVTHGGIDGYSRLITYLQASTNNLSKSVLTACSSY